MTATWTAPRTWTTGELVTASMMNSHVRDNDSWLKTPTESGIVNFAADFTSTSTSFVDVTSLTTTMTTNGGGLDVYFRATVLSSTGNKISFQLVIDGVSDEILGVWYNTSSSVETSFMAFHHVAAISASSHTIKIQTKIASSGTITIKGTTGAGGDPLFYVVERGS